MHLLSFGGTGLEEGPKTRRGATKSALDCPTEMHPTYQEGPSTSVGAKKHAALMSAPRWTFKGTKNGESTSSVPGSLLEAPCWKVLIIWMTWPTNPPSPAIREPYSSSAAK